MPQSWEAVRGRHRQNVCSWQTCGEAAGKHNTVGRADKSTWDIIHPADRHSEVHGACATVGAGRYGEGSGQVSISRSPAAETQT